MKSLLSKFDTFAEPKPGLGFTAAIIGDVTFISIYGFEIWWKKIIKHHSFIKHQGTVKKRIKTSQKKKTTKKQQKKKQKQTQNEAFETC